MSFCSIIAALLNVAKDLTQRPRRAQRNSGPQTARAEHVHELRTPSYASRITRLSFIASIPVRDYIATTSVPGSGHLLKGGIHGPQTVVFRPSLGARICALVWRRCQSQRPEQQQEKPR